MAHFCNSVDSQAPARRLRAWRRLLSSVQCAFFNSDVTSLLCWGNSRMQAMAAAVSGPSAAVAGSTMTGANKRLLRAFIVVKVVELHTAWAENEQLETFGDDSTEEELSAWAFSFADANLAHVGTLARKPLTMSRSKAVATRVVPMAEFEADYETTFGRALADIGAPAHPVARVKQQRGSCCASCPSQGTGSSC